MSRMNIITPVREYEKDGEKKTQWATVGVAFPSRGGGYDLVIHSLPTRRDEQGQIRMMLREPKEYEGRGGLDTPASSADTNDDISW